MKKFVNDPRQFVPEMLKGIALANPDTLTYVPGYNLIMRTDAPRDDKVSIIQGSGSGHEPAHVMIVGKGMLDAACPGDVFAAPPMDYVLETSKLLNSPKGVLHIINNYTGDRMAFEMGQEMAEADGITIGTLLVDDDVAVKDSTYTVGRRGVAGNFFVIKSVGAASEQGAELDELLRIGNKVNSVTRTMGMALTSCTPPAKGSPLFELGDDEMEMGVGIHGEPGRRREKLASANEIVDELLDAVVTDLPFGAGDDVALMVNGLGGTPISELYLLYGYAHENLAQRGINVRRNYVGNYCTSLDMAACRSRSAASTRRSGNCSPRPPRSRSGHSDCAADLSGRSDWSCHAWQMDGEPPQSTRLTRLWKAAESRNIPLRTILTAVGVVVAAYLLGKIVYRLRDVLLLIVIAGFIALLLNPLVFALQRRFVPRRGLAVAVVTVWAALVFAGLAVAFGYPLVNGISHFAQRLPGYVASAQHGTGWVGHLVRRYHFQAWAQQNAPKLVSFGQSLSKPALSVGKGALSLVVELATIFVLVLLLLLEGPKLRTGILGLMSADRAARYTRLAGQVNRSIAGYMVGNLLTSVIAGAVVFITLLVTGVPFAFLWALWVALFDFLPMIGGALAGIPTVLFAAGHSLTTGIVTLVVFLAYTQIENHVLNPIVMSKTVRINPLFVLIAVLVGASLGDWVSGLFGGFVAALIAIPTAGAIQIIARDIWQITAMADQPGQPGQPGQPEDAATETGPPPAGGDDRDLRPSKP